MPKFVVIATLRLDESAGEEGYPVLGDHILLVPQLSEELLRLLSV
jgi:hypothetical protein